MKKTALSEKPRCWIQLYRSSILAVAVVMLGACGFGEELRPAWVTSARRSLMERFFWPGTSLFYDYRTGEGAGGLVGRLPTPEEIAASKPCATGWGSGMEDSVLNGGPFLVSAIDRWEVSGEQEAMEDARKVFCGLSRLVNAGGVEGFLARSVSPEDNKSFYPNSSRDQYTLFVYAIWRYLHSGLSTADERTSCRKMLVSIARFMERTVTKESGWKFANVDGRPGMVAQMWTDRPGVKTGTDGGTDYFGGLCTHEALRLPMIYAAAFDASGDVHWREQELKYADDGIGMANGAWSTNGFAFALFQAQVSHRLLWELERDADRKARYLALMRRNAGFAAGEAQRVLKGYAALDGKVNVYGTDWRQLPTRPTWDDIHQTMPIPREDFAKAHSCIREAAECVLNALICPGEAVPDVCRQAFDTVFERMDYDRTTISVGMAHALMAYWMERKASGEELRRMERLAVEADAFPPELRRDEIGRYSTNNLDFALNNGLEMTRGGRIWASWISGGDGPMSFTAMNWSDDDGQTWTDVKFVINGHDNTRYSRTNIIGTFWLDPDGQLRCYTDQSLVHFDGRAGFWESVCRNPDAKNPVWTPARRLGDGHVINKPIVLDNGDWALAAYLNGTWRNRNSVFNAFPELDRERGAICYVSSDKGATWEKRGVVLFPAENRAEGKVEDWQEAQLVQLRDGTLRMFARVIDGNRGCLMAADSRDYGRTFGPSRRLKSMDNTNARFQIRRLKSGRLIFVKHGKVANSGAQAWQGRDHLTAFLSDDDGETWYGGLLLDEGPGSYPDIFQAPNGLIYVSHDHERYKDAEIWMHCFAEEDVAAGKIVSTRERLGMLIMRGMKSR